MSKVREMGAAILNYLNSIFSTVLLPHGLHQQLIVTVDKIHTHFSHLKLSKRHQIYQSAPKI